MYTEKFDFYSPVNLKVYNLDQTMKYQLDVLGNMDFFTRRHSENVGKLVCRLCEHLHLGQRFTIYCTICGYLHDIGKLFIPPEILQKPGKLTDEEFEIMKTHSNIGSEMLLALHNTHNNPLYDKAYEICRWHHDRYDGKGYVHGLKGEEIPLNARIIGIADVSCSLFLSFIN